MKVSDLLSARKNKILGDESLLLFYMKEFKALFGYTPNCISCSFSSDFNKFKKYYNRSDEVTKLNTMEKYKLKASYNDVIISYKKPKKRTVHIFGRRMNDQQAEDFIKYGKNPKVEEERKAMFSVLPEEENIKTDLLSLTKKELIKLAEDKGIEVNQNLKKAEILNLIENE